MAGTIWEVVGGADKGGILVREGADTKSKEAAARLSTGALVKEKELKGERLNYELLSGKGPLVGWVSVKLKDKTLVEKSDKTPPKPPLLACFYSGGMTSTQGKAHLRQFLMSAKKAGFEDSIVMDHIGEEGYADCKDFDDYTQRLLSKLEKEPKAKDRAIAVVAHSHGTVPAWGLAKRLGERCLKMYVLTRRPPNGELLDTTWNIDSATKVPTLDDKFLLKNMLDAWPNQYLDQFKDDNPLPQECLDVLKVVRRQYSSPVFPCGSADVKNICGDDQAIVAPIMGIAASKEASNGETAERMKGWKDFTQADFELKVAEGDHMGLMGVKSPAFDIIIQDLKGIM